MVRGGGLARILNIFVLVRVVAVGSLASVRWSRRVGRCRFVRPTCDVWWSVLTVGKIVGLFGVAV